MPFLTVSVFYVGTTSSLTNTNTKNISFTVSNIKASNSLYTFSINAASSLKVPQRSLFWFHLCAEVPANTKTNYCLNGFDYPAVVYSFVDRYPADQLTVDTLQWVRSNAILTVSNDEPLFSSFNMETAWLAFRFDNIFNPLVAFAAQLISIKQFNIILIFDRVLVNEGNFTIMKMISLLCLLAVFISSQSHCRETQT